MDGGGLGETEGNQGEARMRVEGWQVETDGGGLGEHGFDRLFASRAQ